MLIRIRAEGLQGSEEEQFAATASQKVIGTRNKGRHKKILINCHNIFLRC